MFCMTWFSYLGRFKDHNAPGKMKYINYFNVITSINPTVLERVTRQYGTWIEICCHHSSSHVECIKIGSIQKPIFTYV